MANSLAVNAEAPGQTDTPGLTIRVWKFEGEALVVVVESRERQQYR